jgi:hypothetical protein
MFEDCKRRNKKPKAFVDASITLGEQNGVVNEKTWNINLFGKKQISIAKTKIGFPKGR